MAVKAFVQRPRIFSQTKAAIRFVHYPHNAVMCKRCGTSAVTEPFLLKPVREGTSMKSRDLGGDRRPRPAIHLWKILEFHITVHVFFSPKIAVILPTRHVDEERGIKSELPSGQRDRINIDVE